MFKNVTNSLNILGECPIWCGDTQTLFWTDIMNSELLAFSQGTGKTRRWSLPERLGSFALTEKPEILLLGLASRLGFYNLINGQFSEIALSPGTSDTRINDGRCDRQGNFVFSTMHEGEPVLPVGKFHRINAATKLVETLGLPEVAIPNSLCFSPDGDTMYYSDSMQKRIFCCDYPSLSNQRLFAQVDGPGAPDGSCVDAQGFIWNAERGGNRVVRYRPDGSVDTILESPCIQTTCPVIAGTGYDTLYCTSARADLSSPSVHDGALITLSERVPHGLPENRFTGRIAV